MSRDDHSVRQAVLLAAGMGTRLGHLTTEVPKCMVPVGGMTIVERAMGVIARVGIEELIIITGHKHDVLEEFVRGLKSPLALTFIHNPDYATTNNIYSLWLAEDAIRRDFLLLESDIVFSESMIADLLDPCAALLSRLAPWMNGTVVTLDENGNVDGMYLKGETRPDRQLFKTVNLYGFDQATWQSVVWPRLDGAVRSGRTGVYYETVFAEAVRQSELHLKGKLCAATSWAEIDTVDDLHRVLETVD